MYNMYSIFIYASRESFSKCWLCFHRNMCMFCPQNSRYDILQMVGSHEANMTVGISQYISSDCHPELQSQMHSSLEDISVPQNSTFQNQIYGCHPTYLHFVWYFQFHLIQQILFIASNSTYTMVEYTRLFFFFYFTDKFCVILLAYIVEVRIASHPGGCSPPSNKPRACL